MGFYDLGFWDSFLLHSYVLAGSCCIWQVLLLGFFMTLLISVLCRRVLGYSTDGRLRVE